MSRRPVVPWLVVLLLPGIGCEQKAVPVLREASVAPLDEVAACQPLTVRLSLEAVARYTISADDTPLAAGVAYGGVQEIPIDALPDPQPGATTTRLSVTVVGVSGAPERRNFVLTRSTNAAPHANAGPVRRGTADSPIQLDGSGSRDPDGDDLSFLWSVIDGDAPIDGSTTARPSITLAEPGAVRVQLTVSDGHGGSSTDEVVVRAQDAGGPPEFDDRSDSVAIDADPGGELSIDVHASAPGSARIHYQVVQTAGPEVEIVLDGAVATVKIPDAEGLVALEARADDGFEEVRKRISILVGTATLEDAPGTARISGPQSAPVLSTVVLDASASTDPEQSNLGYLWTVEEAPAGSLLGAATIAGNGTAAAATASVVLDRVGDYRFRLRVVDAVGSSPTAAEIEVRSTADIVRATVNGTVHDLAVDEDGQALAALRDDDGLVLVRATGTTLAVESEATGGVVYSPSRGVFYYARNGVAAPATLHRYDPVGSSDAEQVLPADEGEDLPSVVSEIGVDPSTGNRGDLFLATSAGFVILDVSDADLTEPIGHPLPIGTEAVHQPPTFNGEGEAALDVLDLRGPGGTVVDTEVFAGNGFWLTELDQPPSTNFTSAPIDPLADDVADPIVALAVSADYELAMLEGRGLVWMRGDGGSDCLLSSLDEANQESASRRCPAPPADRCARALSVPGPADVADMVATEEGTFWVASSDGIRLFDPTNGTFLQLGAESELEGASAIDLRDGVLAVGRAGQVVLLDLR